jgi:hypothetical protein
MQNKTRFILSPTSKKEAPAHADAPSSKKCLKVFDVYLFIPGIP